MYSMVLGSPNHQFSDPMSLRAVFLFSLGITSKPHEQSTDSREKNPTEKEHHQESTPKSQDGVEKKHANAIHKPVLPILPTS